jgi:zeaxanthin glucosyltransferase
MAKIVFITLFQAGHLFPTFKLARKLQSRQHRVVYAVPDSIAETITQNGLEAEILANHDALMPAQDIMVGTVIPDRNTPSKELLALVNRYYQYYMFSEEPRQFLQKLKPDLVIVDSIIPFAAMIPYALGIPFVTLSAILPRRRMPEIPPLTTTMIPPGNARDRFRVWCAWQKVIKQQKVVVLSRKIMGIKADWHILTRDLARQAHYPPHNIQWQSVFSPTLNAPELILCPFEFDFPQAYGSSLHYIGAMMDYERKEQDHFPWERIRPDLPLIYCSMGSQHSSQTSSRLFQMVIQVMRNFPGLQCVISLGRRNSDKEFQNLPENAIVVEWTPQLSLLEKARVMITHGGLGSIKESIFYNTPMLVIPQGRDQPGNAARVAYHQLGLLQNPSQVTPETISRDIKVLLEDTKYQHNVQAMRIKFLQVEEQAPGVALIERMAGMRPE